jgi:hypothetical protein
VTQRLGSDEAGWQTSLFTWHVHGAYLYYLSQAPHDFYVPVMDGRPEGYGGRAGTLPWPDNLHEVPAEAVKELALDCVVFQSKKNYLIDQYRILSDAQRSLPRIYLEHDPPQESPTNTPHIVDDPAVLLVHVTHFNDLMWDAGKTPTRVIEHGVMVPEGLAYTGSLARGISVVNGLPKRGRRLGLDVDGAFYMAKAVVPGMMNRRNGHIVNIASTAAKRAWPNASAYQASKWGVLGLSHALHSELRSSNVKVRAVVPGGMRTPFLLDRFEDIDVSTLQDPQAVADTVRFVLCQPEGTVIPEVMVLPMQESSWP